jgi:hypothetical protein
MPGVTLVRSISAHVHGHRKESTIAAAYSRCTLPMISSPRTGGRMIARGVQRPALSTMEASMMPPHAHTAASKGSMRNGQTAWKNAGE